VVNTIVSLLYYIKYIIFLKLLCVLQKSVAIKWLKWDQMLPGTLDMIRLNKYQLTHKLTSSLLQSCCGYIYAYYDYFLEVERFVRSLKG